MLGIRSIKLLALVLLLAVAAVAGEFHIGPGQEYDSIGRVPWYALSAGDTVYIHYREKPYHEKLLISGRGTPDNWIRVIGVPGPEGQRPVISGDQATTSANMHFRWQAASGASAIQWSGIVQIAYRQEEDAPKPGYIEIAGLQIQDASPNYSFTAENGTATRYEAFSACIYSRSAEHILIRNNLLTNCGLGFYNWTGSSGQELQVDTVLRGNIFSDNGVPDDYYEHTVYTESDGVTIEGNHFGPMKRGALGSQIKDRSAGTVIRYNLIEQSEGWLIDLVEAQNGAPALTARPSYRQSFVYSNVLLNVGDANGSAIHWNGDQGPGGRADLGGTLFFYHNTFVTARDEPELWKFSVFSVHQGGGSCGEKVAGTIDLRNNLLVNVSRTPGQSTAEMFLAGCGIENFRFGTNWISPGWRYAFSASSASYTGTATQVGKTISPADNDPAFLDLPKMNVRLGPGSTALGIGGPLAPEVTANSLGLDLTPLYQYSEQQGIVARQDQGDGSTAGALGKIVETTAQNTDPPGDADEAPSPQQ